MKVRFVVPRRLDDEFTVALVTADVEPSLQHESRFLEQLRAAITKWVRAYASGYALWEQSCHDLNIADISSYIRDEDLIDILIDHGIRDFDIDLFCYEELCRNWTYDTVLVNEGDRG